MDNDLDNLLPSPEQVSIIANINPDNINRLAFRRSKVREMSRMGYDVSQICIVLKRIKTKDGQPLELTVSEAAIRSDIDYIRQEDISSDPQLPAKRAEIMDKLLYLYNRAISDANTHKGAIRNSFLNTALAILDKRIELEGLKSSETTDERVSSEMKVSKFAEEMQKLPAEEKNELITTINKILRKRESAGTGEPSLPNGTPSIPAPSSDDAEIS